MPLKYNVNEKYKTEKKKHIKKNFNGQTNIVDKYTNIRMYVCINDIISCVKYKKIYRQLIDKIWFMYIFSMIICIYFKWRSHTK